MLGYVVAGGDLKAYAGSGRTVRLVRLLLVRDTHVPGRVDPRLDGVAHAARLDCDRLGYAEAVGDADGRRQGVALCATRRRAVRSLIRYANVVVENLAHDLGRYTGAIVGDGNPDRAMLVSRINAYLGRNAGGLAGIEGVVYQLL